MWKAKRIQNAEEKEMWKNEGRKKTEQQQQLNNGHGISIGPPKITEEND